MSPIQKAQKIHAMKSQSRRQLFHSFMLQAIIALACSFIFSTFSSSSLKHLSLTSLPHIWSSMFNPKCLFVIVNVIVVFLVGESKIGTTKSCPADNIYKEYVERSKSQRNASSPRGEKKMKEEVAARATEQVYEECMEIKPSINDEIDALASTKVGRDMVIVNKKASRDKEILKQGDNCGKKERALLGAEELNKRAEDFIARVNKQRRLEQYSVL